MLNLANCAYTQCKLQKYVTKQTTNRDTNEQSPRESGERVSTFSFEIPRSFDIIIPSLYNKQNKMYLKITSFFMNKNLNPPVITNNDQ